MIGSLQMLGAPEDDGWFDCKGASYYANPSCWFSGDTKPSSPSSPSGEVEARMEAEGSVLVQTERGDYLVYKDGTIAYVAGGDISLIGMVWKPGEEGYAEHRKGIVARHPTLKKYTKGMDMLPVIAAGAGALALVTILIALLTRKRGK
jgi:hypothetical protein